MGATVLFLLGMYATLQMTLMVCLGDMAQKTDFVEVRIPMYALRDIMGMGIGIRT